MVRGPTLLGVQLCTSVAKLYNYGYICMLQFSIELNKDMRHSDYSDVSNMNMHL